MDKLNTPQWLGRPTLHADHHHGLELDSAVNEFGSKMPRQQAEDEAYKKYLEKHRTEALHHHHLGMKAAAAAGDSEAARRHHMMYETHAKHLGLDPMAPPPARPSTETASKVYKFKAHKGDAFSVLEHEGKKEEKTPELSKSQREALYYVWLGAQAVLLKAEKKKYARCFTCKKQKTQDQMHLIAGHSKCQECVDKLDAKVNPDVGTKPESTKKAEAAPGAGIKAVHQPHLAGSNGTQHFSMHLPTGEHIGYALHTPGSTMGVKAVPKVGFEQHANSFGTAVGHAMTGAGAPNLKAEMKTEKKHSSHCHCSAYSFCHRFGGGKCKTEK